MKQIFKLSYVLFFLFACSNKEQKFDDKTYVENKESLVEKEKVNPLTFLTVKGDDKKHLLGKTVIRGTITNTASLAAYKDIRVKMQCFKNAKQVEEHEDVIKETVLPNSIKNFKTRYRLPKGTDSIALSVMNAVYANSKDK